MRDDVVQELKVFGEFSLDRGVTRNFTGTCGLLLPQVVFIHDDNQVRFFNFVTKSWASTEQADGCLQSSIKMDNTIRHCVVFRSPLLPQYQRILSIWTALNVINGSSTSAVAQLRLRNTEGALDDMSIVRIQEFAMTLPAVPSLVCALMDTKLLVYFEKDDLGIHELLVRSSPVGHRLQVVRVIRPSGCEVENLDLISLRDSGLSTFWKYDLKRKLTDGLTATFSLLQPESFTKRGCSIVSMCSTCTPDHCLLVTVDNKDTIRMYTLAHSTEETYTFTGIMQRTYDTFALCGEVSLSSLIEDLPHESKTQINISRVVGNIVGSSLHHVAGTSATFKLFLVSAKAKRLEVIIDFKKKAYTAESLEKIPLPKCIPQQAPLNPMIKLQSPSAVSMPLMGRDHPIDEYMAFDRVHHWLVGPIFTSNADKTFNGTFKSIFSLQYLAQPQNGYVMPSDDPVNLVIDATTNGLWHPGQNLTCRTINPRSSVSPALSYSKDFFDLALLNLMLPKSSQQELDDEVASPPYDQSSWASSAAIVPAVSPISTRLLVFSDRLLKVVDVTSRDFAMGDTVKESFIAAMSGDTGDSGCLAEYASHPSFLNIIARVNFLSIGDIVHYPVVTRRVKESSGDITGEFIINPSIRARMDIMLPFLRRLRRNLSYPIHSHFKSDVNDDRSDLHNLSPYQLEKRRFDLIEEFAELLVLLGDVNIEDSVVGRRDWIRRLENINLDILLDHTYLMNELIAYKVKEYAADRRFESTGSLDDMDYNQGVGGELLSKMVDLCPHFITFKTIQDHLHRLEEEAESSPGEILQLLLRNSMTGNLYILLSELISRLMKNRKWDMLLSILYLIIEKHDVNKKTSSEQEPSAMYDETPRTQISSTDLKTEMYEFTRDSFQTAFGKLDFEDQIEFIRAFKDHSHGTPKEVRRDIVGWVLTYIVDDCSTHNPLKKLLSQLEAQKRGERYRRTGIRILDSLITAPDTQQWTLGILKDYYGIDLDYRLSLKLKLVLYSIMEDGLHLLMNQIENNGLVDCLIADFEYTNEDVIRLINYYAMYKGWTTANLELSDDWREAIVQKLSYDEEHLIKLWYLYEGALKHIERHIGNQHGREAKIRVDNETETFFNRTDLIARYKSDPAARFQLIERYGLAVTEECLQAMLDAESKCFAYKMLLTAVLWRTHTKKFNMAADQSVRLYDLENFTISFLGIIYEMLSESISLDEILFCAADKGASFGRFWETYPSTPNVFGHSDVKELMNAIRQQQEEGLGDVVTRGVNMLLAARNKELSESQTQVLRKLISENTSSRRMCETQTAKMSRIASAVDALVAKLTQ